MQKVLIVGNDLWLQDTVPTALADGGFATLSASDGREALFQLGLFQPDLVILDLLLPGQDSWVTLKRIRELSSVPIIALGTRYDQETEVKSLDFGADHYVAKPCGTLELCARVRALLRRVEGAHAGQPVGVSGPFRAAQAGGLALSQLNQATHC